MRLGGEMLATTKANFEPKRGGPIGKEAGGIGNGPRCIEAETWQNRAQKRGMMSPELLAPAPAMQAG